MTTRRAGLDEAIRNLQALKDSQSAPSQYTAEEVLQTLREAGYTITPPGQQPHVQSYNNPSLNRRRVIQEKLADPNTAIELLDRSRPMPEWARGNEALVLQELEKVLLGVMDAQQPFR